MYDRISLFNQLAQSDQTPLETYTPLIKTSPKHRLNGFWLA